ncbi:MAG: YtxH domain-containing protein [Chloroflexi bacterium]|nr:YtxH domain-containing protein [Chloroflexota bacterium]
MEEQSQGRVRIMVIGAVVGALVGLGAAYLLAQRANKDGKELRLSTGEGMRLGMLILGMLRQVSRLGDGKD